MRYLVLLLALLLFQGAGAQEKQHRGHHKGHHHGKKHDFSDAKKWIGRFEEPSRAKWQKPDLVVRKLGLKPGMNVADLGAASGYFTRRMAKYVSPGGVAFAVDIEKNFFPYVLERAYQEGQYNLFTIECTYDDPRLPEKAIDLVLIVNTLHHIQERPAYYDRLKKALRDGGRVVVVDFKKFAEIPVGPSPAGRLKAQRVLREFQEAGFSVDLDYDTLEFQYIVTARLKPRQWMTP